MPDGNSRVPTIIAIVSLIAVAIIGAVAWASKSIFGPEPPSGVTFEATDVYCNMYGNLTAFDPPSSNVAIQIPQTITVEGKAGETGHVAVGLFGMYQWRDAYLGYPYKKAVVEVKLNSTQIAVDAGFVRLGLATVWYRQANDTYYYLEFDLWDSDETIRQMPDDTYIWNNPNGNPPTIEVKSTQLVVGNKAKYQFPIYDYFVKAFGITDVEIDGCYIVIEKTDASSVFGMSVDLTFLGLA